MYSALTIAKYIIQREKELGHSISNLKLQKILYFIQAEFLVTQNTPCFPEEIIATTFGPIIKEVYQEYKIYGSSIIPNHFLNSKTYITKKDQELINALLDELRNYNSSSLTDITLNQSPWLETYSPNQNKPINLKKIKSFFQNP